MAEELQCPFCPKKYKSQRHYYNHIASKHPSGEATVEEPQAAGMPAKPERQEYVCGTPCWHNGTRYRKGQYAWFAGNYPKDRDGNLRHFEPLNPGAPRPEMEPPLVTVTPQ